MKPPPASHTIEIAHFARFAGIADMGGLLGLDPAILEDPEGTAPITTVYDAIELAAERSGRSDFGLRFALYWTKVSPGGLGTMQFLILSSPTLRIACERILRYQRLWNAAEWYETADSAGTYTVRYQCWGPPRPAHVHQAEKTAVLTVLVPRGVDPACTPLSVSFPHARRDDDEKLRRILGVTPTYGASRTEVVLPAGVMDKPLRDANPALFTFMDRYLASELAALPRDEGSYVELVRSAVRRKLHEGGFGPEMVARAMRCGARTLARRLADEGTSLRSIVDTVRRERAESLLEAKTPIAEVAYLLGYSEPAALLHAFRRWHGTTPKAWREARGSSLASIAAPTTEPRRP